MINFVKNSVAAKVSLIISLMVFLSAFVIGTILYFAGESLVESNHFQDLDNRSELFKESFHHQFDSWVNLGRYLNGLEEGGTSRFKRLDALLKDEININRYWYGYRIKDQDGLVLRDEALFLEGKGVEAKVELDNFTFMSEFELSSQGDPFFMIRIETRSHQIELFFNFEKFFNEGLDYWKMGSSEGVIYLFDNKGHFIYHPQEFKRYSAKKEIKYSIFDEFNKKKLTEYFKSSSQRSVHLTGKINNRKTLNIIKSLSYNGRNIFHIIFGEEKRLTPFHHSLLKVENVLIVFSMLIGFSFLGWIFVRYLLRNLDEITRQAQLFTQGEHDIDIHVKSGDEIGILALTFQAMIRQVNERTGILKKSERRIREARDQAENALNSKSQLLEDLRKQKAEIERVSKDKDDLLAIVSHDLKNPLAVVETSMDLILEEEGRHLSETTHDLIRRSKNSARVALNLITDLLDLSRLEGGIKLDLERFNVEEMVNSVIDSFYLKSKEKNIDVILHQKRKYDLLADYGRVIQILSNIIGNSIKFTPENGSISIEIGEYRSQQDYDGIFKGLEIKITDTGPGIPKEKLESIFNKFEQARKKDREIGTGLGLTISKNICELHNGSISVESEEGKGATFIIRLPRLLDQDQRDEGIQKENSTIIVANDEAEFRREAKIEFSQWGHQVIEAKNGEELLLLLESHVPHLIILDGEMPVKNGIEVLYELKNRANFKVPILLLSDAHNMNSSDFEDVKSLINDVMPHTSSIKDIFKRSEVIMNAGMVTSFNKNLDPNKKTILVVDDEEGIRNLMQDNFISKGYNCIIAKSGVEALFLVHKYRVDLVISDMRMIEVDGIRLTNSIKDIYPEVVIFLMSANVDSISSELKKKLGVRDSFSKPFDIDDICMAIREEIGASSLDREIDILRVKEEERRKVLLVDDSEDMQALFKALLRHENLELSLASNGAEAVEKFKEEHYDIIFMDMNMPIMGGVQAAALMRELERDKESYLVLLSAEYLKSADEVKKLGFDSYLQKPLNKEKILEEISRAQKSN